MHIQFTTSEILGLLRQTYNLPDGIPIKIVDEPGSVKFPTHYEFVADIEKHFGSIIESHNKISAIKHVRTLIPGCGLADAKTIIENWSRYKEWMALYQMLPFNKDSRLIV